MIELGVNIDHVATVREARKGREPDPVWAAVEAQTASPCTCAKTGATSRTTTCAACAN